MRRILRLPLLTALVIGIAAGSPSAPAAAQSFPPDSAVLRILQERVATNRNPGIVVGLYGPEGREVLAAGTTGVENLPLDGQTVLEIGSITKVFTAALLASVAATGEVRLDQPVAELLPDGPAPRVRGRPIQLVDLATHASGLPRLPTNLPYGDRKNPYADYTPDLLHAFLAGHRHS